MWIYYFGMNRDHSHRLDSSATKEETAISRAVMRVDGFISADADYEGGTFLTPPMQFTGSRQFLLGGVCMVTQGVRSLLYRALKAGR